MQPESRCSGCQGWGLYLLGGKPVFHYNYGGVQRSTFAGKEKLAPGKHVILVDFKHNGGGIGKGGSVTLSVNDKPVAEGRLERTIPLCVSLDEPLDVGGDTGTSVSGDNHVPFNFTGMLNRVVIRLGEGQLSAGDEEQIRRAKAAISMSQ